MENISDKKKLLRKDIKKRIRNLDLETVKQESSMVCEKLTVLPSWQKNSTVLLFFSMEGKELDTSCIIQKGWDEGKKLAFPRMYGDEILFHYVDKSDMPNLETHPYGVLEPDKSLPVYVPSEENRALIVVPGLGFDASGRRIGRGKGYYDRYLSRYSAFLDIAGIALSCQLTDEIPVDERDKTIPVVITPNMVYYNSSTTTHS